MKKRLAVQVEDARPRLDDADPGPHVGEHICEIFEELWRTRSHEPVFLSSARPGRGSRTRRCTPFPVLRTHLRSEHVLPRRVHHAIDPQLEHGLRGVSHVLGIPEDAATRRLILDEHRVASDIELVASGLRLRKGLKGVPAVPQEVVPLRGRGGDEHEEPVAGQDRAHRMKARGTVLPYRGEKGEPNLELEEQGSMSARSGCAAANSFQVTMEPPQVAECCRGAAASERRRAVGRSTGMLCDRLIGHPSSCIVGHAREAGGVAG